MWEERRLRVFENRGVEENIWVSEGRGDRGVEENYIRSSLMICTPHPILLGL